MVLCFPSAAGCCPAFHMQPKSDAQGHTLGAHSLSSVCSCASFQALNKRHIPPQLHSNSPDCELPGSRFLRRLCCGDSVPPSPATAASPSPQTCVSLPVQGLVSICTCKCRHLFRPVEELHKLPAQPSSDGYKFVLSPTAMIGCLTEKQTADRGPSGLLLSLVSSQKNMKSSLNIL